MVNLFIIISVIGLTASLCQVLAWASKIPAIFYLLIAGTILGPVTGAIIPDKIFGHFMEPVISLSVAVILFEASLQLCFSQIEGQGILLSRLLLVGPIITWGVIFLVTVYSGLFSWQGALLFGAIMVVSGPTVIMPILQVVKMKDSVALPLLWESIILDPLSGLLASLVIAYIASSQNSIALTLTFIHFLHLICFGLIVGFVNGLLLGWLASKKILPKILLNVVSLNWLICAFSFSNVFVPNTGLIVVTIMGIVLANTKGVDLKPMIKFKETLSVLLLSAVFLLLAANVEFVQLKKVIPVAVVLFIVTQLVIQPIKVAIASYGTTLSFKERLVIAWIAPRGIVAATITSLMAIKLKALGFHQAVYLVPLCFIYIMLSVIFPSITTGYLVKKLHLEKK